jgi:hypothetical protein
MHQREGGLVYRSWQRIDGCDEEEMTLNFKKSIELFASTALVAVSFSPLAIAPAQAAINPSSTTTDAMDAQCLADLGTNAAVQLHDGNYAFSTEAIETSQLDGPTTEVAGSRVETPGTRFGTGTATYSGITILGDPYKVGGSVNMFGKQGAKYKNWPGSEYDFTADYSTTTTILYKCEVTQVTETYHPPVHIPGHKVQGFYINCDFGHGQGNDNSNSCDETGQPQGSCAAHNGTGDSLPFWGTDTEQCKFIKTGDAVDPVDEDEFWTNNPPIVRADLGTTHSINETNVAEDVMGHEVNGGPFTETAPVGTLYNAGQVVVCISPSTTLKKGVPGEWRTQNGYTGSKCTTVWYNATTWGAGTDSANGTLISVPAI